MGRPKASEARDTRRDLLEASLELFALHGFHGAGLRDIARAAGVRESAVYHHFPSKEALFEALLTEAPDGAPSHAESFANAPLPARLDPFLEELLVGMLERFATLRERKRFRLLMNDGMRLALEGRVSLMDRMGGAARAHLQRLMHRLVEERRLRGDPEFLALSFVAPVIVWRQLQELQPGHRYFADLRGFARLHVAQFLLGARAPATGPLAGNRKLVARSPAGGATEPATADSDPLSDETNRGD